MMNSNEINQLIRQIERSNDKEDKWIVKGLEDTGKCIPHIGWFWRDIDWDAPFVPMGIIPAFDTGFDAGPGFVGFMVKNKWDYVEFAVGGDEKDLLRKMVEDAIVEPTSKKFQELFDHIQSLKNVV